MHNMLYLNKFENSYQILEKNSRIHKECLHKFIWCKLLITNTLGIKVHKMYERDKNQVPYYNVNLFLKWLFKKKNH